MPTSTPSEPTTSLPTVFKKLALRKLVRPAALASGLVALGACATGGNRMSDKYEKPSYRVVTSEEHRGDRYEVRRYAPYLVAAVTVPTEDFQDATNQGFRILADYIFGGNRPRAAVAMTVPVTARPASDDRGEKLAMTAPVEARPSVKGWEITFMMPASYTLASLPVPNDDRVRLLEVEPRCVATLGFTGFAREAKISDHRERLVEWVAARGLEARGEVAVAQYDDPFTLPWNRWTEVQVPLGDGACERLAPST